MSEYLDERLTAAKQAARHLPEAHLREIGAEAATAEIVGEHQVEALSLRAEQKWMSDPVEVDVDVRGHPNIMSVRRGPAKFPGMRYTIHVPFDGDAELFDLQPNMTTGTFPQAEVDQQLRHLNVIVDVPRIDDAASQVKARLDKQIDLLSGYMRAQEVLISGFNEKLPVAVRQILDERRTHLDATKAAIAAIGIPLVPKAGAPQLPIALERKIEIRRAQARASDHGTPVDRAISDEDYESILSLIRHQCRTFEGAPAAFAALEEEHLRDVIRASLNAIYRGATAETFRNRGKTDICIEADSRSAFVTECKIWSGGKALSSAVDQLLSYMIWRDCKAAIVVFNKSVQNFADLVDNKALPPIVNHSQFVRTLSSQPDIGEWRVVLRHSAGHDVSCHLMIYNLHYT